MAKPNNIILAYRSVQEEILLDRERRKLPKATRDDYPDIDLTASIRLLEQGFPLADVRNVLRKYSPELKALNDDPKAMDIYISHVFQEVNAAWDARSKKTMEDCKNAYVKRASGLLKKYTDYKTIGLYQDGAIGIALMQKDKYPLPVVLKTIRQNSLGKKTDASYFAALQLGLTAVNERYAAIARPQNEYSANPADVYRGFAQKYMQETRTAVLAGRDEQNIVRRMGAYFFGQMQKNGVLDEKTRQSIWENNLEPFIQKGIKEASPIYPEPGRNKDQYLMSLVAELEDQFEQEKSHSAGSYAETEDLYLKRKNEMKERMERYRTHADTFFDGLIAKELLDSSQPADNIAKAIAKNSAAEPSMDRESYARIMLEKAQKCLHAEKEIINLDSVEIYPPGTTFAMLKEKNVTMTHLFRQMMRERLSIYPSFQLELTEPYADRDAVEKLMHKFPDFNRNALVDAIEEASPRAQLPGCPPDYAEKLIQEVEERLRKVEEREKKQLTIQKQYNRLRGLSSEGVYEESTPMDSYKDGKIAVKMLRRGVSKDDIKRYLTAVAKATIATATIATAALYAGQILDKAQEFLAKEQAIRNYSPQGAMQMEQGPTEGQVLQEPPTNTSNLTRAEAENAVNRAIEEKNRAEGIAEDAQKAQAISEARARSNEEEAEKAEASRQQEASENETPTKTPSCKELYMEKMHERFSEKGFAQASMDIAVMKDMMLTSRYTPEQIQQVVKDNSPVAIEPGRDTSYVDYVRTMAEQEIDREKEKLQHYVVVPRLLADSEKTPEACAAEYAYQKDAMDDAIHLPHDFLMDVMIATALIKDHYDKSEVKGILDENAPSDWLEENPDRSYGQTVMESVANDLSQSFDLTETQELVRTITTTTTTTTTTTFTDTDA